MYYKRQFQGGGGPWDPRQKTFAVFHCDVCGNEEFIEVKHPGLLKQILPCPQCKMTGKDDKVIVLTKRQSQLEQERLRINQEIEQITKELNSIDVQKRLDNQTIKVP